MMHLVVTVVHVARTHALLAYSLAFLLTGAEAFPVIGALVPGTAIIIALGALVPAGALHFWPLVGWATGGAIAGDGLPFWFGYKNRNRATQLWPLSRYPRILPQGEAFFERHGGSAVVIARFTPGVRAIVPIVAGISGMRPIRFYILDVVSALLWAPAHVAAGVLVGASLMILGVVAGRLEALFLGFVIGLGLLLWLMPKLIRFLVTRLKTVREPILIWSRARDSWIRRPIASLLDPTRTELSGLIFLAGVLTGSLWLVLGILQDLIAGDPLIHADHAIFHFFDPYRSGRAIQFAIVIARLGSGPVTLAIAAVALIWLDRLRAWRAAAYGIAAVIGASFFAAGLDLALHRPPPPHVTPGWSLIPFPGGDLATATALYGFLAVIAGRALGGRHRATLTSIIVAFAALQLCARVFLGMDWLSTTLVAVAFGFAWAACLGLAYVARPVEPVPPWRLVVIIAATLAVTAVPAVALNRHADFSRYETGYAGRTLTCQAWLHHGWQTLPARSLDMLGSFTYSLAIQWVGSTATLRAVLIREGWQLLPHWSFHSALAFLSPHVSAVDLPALPRLDDGRPADFVMVLAGHGLPAGKRLVLRLWKSGISVTSPKGYVLPLRVGEIERQRLERMISMLTLPFPSGSQTSALPAIAAALPGAHLATRNLTTDPVLLAGALEAQSPGCLMPSPARSSK